ncbi:dienelactone hydrolase family protein [Nocardioides sp. Kera G14]|uniref:dienelactone hydrolase family protein n=1 Tax=Nocardioides sp. Kera G14 TaxID=2884264 RepID=UPI001D106012|nr:dienelactone hydrolase family protein [Nocardioides sp. Kera G14]UDY23448.1 dienelactone hydrolase family protein [Nocardioides sp. Kera G14]
MLIRDLPYAYDGTPMLGCVVAPDASDPSADDVRRAGVLLIHDAFGISDEMRDKAQRLADLGHPVLLADVWGERLLPHGNDEIGPLIGGMVADRPTWLGRLHAALAALAGEPEFAGRPLALLGYCFGGSSALELLRTGTRVDGVIAIHAGLDLLEDDWSAPGSAQVLICTGADDPMATGEQRGALHRSLDAAGLDWELQIYSGTTHAFTSPKAADSPVPHLFKYHPRSAARAWDATVRFLADLTENR